MLKSFGVLLISLAIFISFSILVFLHAYHIDNKSPNSKELCFAPFDPDSVIPLSHSPRIYLYKNFVRQDEIDYLIRLAGTDFTQSMTVNKNGKIELDSERTSSGKTIVSFLK